MSNKMSDKMSVENVKITNINMPFWALVGFMLKAYFALIVASIVVGVLGGVVFLILTAIIAGLSH
jgi:hypothetical protein